MSNKFERLFNARTPDVDEVPDFVDVEVAMGCNLRCPMCPLSDRETHLAGRAVTLMPPDLFGLLLDQVSDRPRVLHLNIMGEPLINPETPDFVRRAKARGHFVSFNTNGTRMTPEVAAELVAAGIDRVVFSLDGFTRETYESIRVGAGRDAVFENVRRFAELNRGRGVTQLKYIVSDKTAGEREAFTRYWEPLVDEVEFVPLNDWAGQFELPGALGGPRWDAGAAVARHPCHSLWLRASVSAEGNVLVCCHDFKRSSGLPSIREKPLPAIWNDEVRAFRRDQAAGRYALSPCACCHEWKRMAATFDLFDRAHLANHLKDRFPRLYQRLRRLRRRLARLLRP